MGRVRKYIRKQFSRAKTYVKSRYSGPDAVMRVVQDVSKLKRLVNTERKQIFNAGLAEPKLGATAVYLINPIPSGEGPQQRNGRSVKMMSIQLRAFTQLTTDVNLTNVCRCIIFIDKEPQRGQPLSTDLLETDSPSALRNWEQQTEKRFTVLYDKFVTNDPTKQTARIEFYKRVNAHVRFNGEGGGDISNNKLYLMFLSDNTGAAGNFQVNWQSRVTYVDN